MIPHPRKQCPPHDSLKYVSSRSKITGVPTRPFAEGLSEAVANQVYRGDHTTMWTSGRRCLSIANLMKSDRLLLKPEYLPGPSARQPVISVSECKVNKVVVRVNKERSIELTNPRWNI